MLNSKQHTVLSFVLSISLLTVSIVLVGADQSVEKAELPTHSLEGESERISFTFAESLDEDLYLEVYEFHDIMFPELAPAEDTWVHEKQMSFMTDVLEGRAEPFRPQFSDKRVQRILELSPKQIIKLSSIDKRNYYADWKAKHGRIFFRLKTPTGYIDKRIYTMRVHCRHVDMRSVELLKEQLVALKLPLTHKNGPLARNFYQTLFSTYALGHSLQFMLRHHERDTGDLDIPFQQLSRSISESDFDRAEKLVDSLRKEVRAQEEFFYQLGVTGEDGAIRVNIADNINAYSFYHDPAVEVYASEYSEPSIGDLAAITHGGGLDHSRVDPSRHQQMMKPDKKMLTNDAIKLEPSGDAFTGILPEKWREVSIVVFYGADQGYYLTNHFVMD